MERWRERERERQRERETERERERTERQKDKDTAFCHPEGPYHIEKLKHIFHFLTYF